jgi:hypothetical protein
MPLQLLTPAAARPFATKPAGGWPAVTGTIRPPLPREVRGHYAKLQSHGENAEAAVRCQAEFYAGLIKSWDVSGGDGQPAPVTAEAVGALPFPVWSQLDDLALGYFGEHAPA